MAADISELLRLQNEMNGVIEQAIIDVNAVMLILDEPSAEQLETLAQLGFTVTSRVGKKNGWIAVKAIH